MAKKDETGKGAAADGARARKRGKRRRSEGPLDFAALLAEPPVGTFHAELVVGNGIGDNAVADALEAFRRAYEVRRRKALEAAQQHPGNGDGAEQALAGPFTSRQEWRIDDEAQPMTATTWCWVGYQSVRFPPAT